METTYKGTNKLIIGIVFGVITFWLFAQAMVNIVPAVQEDLGVSLGTLNIAISLSALFSGLFIVVAGGLADRVGRKKLTYIGLILSVIGSLSLVLANWCDTINNWTCLARVICCMYYASNDCISEGIFRWC